MSQFRDKPWNQRVGTLGDEAESHFEQWAKRNRRGYCRYGLNRPPIKFYALPARLRHTPDFLTSNCFVEAQGFGREQRVRLKLEKHGALHHWHSVFPVQLYLWDREHERECFVTLPTLDDVIGQSGAELNAFPEGKSFFDISADALFHAAGETCP